MLVANWKMNQKVAEAEAYIAQLNEFIVKDSCQQKIVIAPSFPHLPLFSKVTNFSIAGQNVSEFYNGAHTGEVSADQLLDLGCKYVIVGHSERRANNFETNKKVHDKALHALKSSLVPIICVGETEEEKKKGQTSAVLSKQIRESVPNADFPEIVVAYEPVWAIGSGAIPEISDIQEAVAIIREELSALNSFEKNFSILYGGSVNIGNCKDIISIDGINGLLIGGASLVADKFINIIKKIS